MRKHCTDLPLAQAANGSDIVIVKGNFKEEGSGTNAHPVGFDELLGLEQGQCQALAGNLKQQGRAK